MTENPDTKDFSDKSFFREIFTATFGYEPPDNLLEEANHQSLTEFFEINQLEADLGLPNGFFTKLLDEDDWSFIIKLHALIEASVTHLLVKHFNEPTLETVFSFLELSNLRTGKLAFASSTGLIDTDIKRFIQKLSEMRNAFVHDVTNVNIQIKDFLDNIKEDDRKGYRKGFLFGYKEGQKIQVRIGEDAYDAKALLQLFNISSFDLVPKLSIWFGSLICLSRIYNHVLLAELRVQKQTLNEHLVKLLENVIQSSQPPDS